MSLVSFYPQIKHLHLGLVAASGLFFALRGLCAVFGARWPRQSGVRVAAVVIDTLLLASAVLLLSALKLNPFVVAWLQVKLVLLVGYVACGAVAMKRRSILAWVLALLCFAAMVSVARTHHPLGALARLL